MKLPPANASSNREIFIVTHFYFKTATLPERLMFSRVVFQVLHDIPGNNVSTSHPELV